MVGLFEPVAAPWSLDKIPDDFSFGEIPSNWDRLGPFLEYAMEILPGLEDVGIRKLFTGPESFTPDIRCTTRRTSASACRPVECGGADPTPVVD